MWHKNKFNWKRKKRGHLTVLYEVEKTTETATNWNCRCECGRERIVNSRTLTRNNKNLSCGQCEFALKSRDLRVGLKIGSLTVLEFIKFTDWSSVWKFRCDCGKEFIEEKRQILRRGYSHLSCGCKKKHKNTENAILREDKIVINQAYLAHLRGALERGYCSELSREQYEEIIRKPCRYCGKFSIRKHIRTHKEFPLNSVDRLNNEPYYKLENSVPCCFHCQTSKLYYTEKEYLKHCSDVIEFQITKEIK